MSNLIARFACRTTALMLAVVMLSGLGGCRMLSRSLGHFPVTNRVVDDDKVLVRDTLPVDSDLWVRVPEKTPGIHKYVADAQNPGYVLVPLVRVFYQEFANSTWAVEPGADKDYFMIIDTSNLIRMPDFGAGYQKGSGDDADEEKRKRRIRGKISEILLAAADWNGEVYWRRFSTFAQYHDALKSGTKALSGAAIASSFISPVVGAAMGGASLGMETFLGDLTDDFDNETIASFKNAGYLFREAERLKIRKKNENLKLDEYPISELINDVNRYAYTYSIKGAAWAVAKQNANLEQVLKAPGAIQRTSAASEWQLLFQDRENAIHLRSNNTPER